MQKAVILAGGLGKRMLPLTKCIQKPLLPLGMSVASQIVARECVKAGAKQICFVVASDSSVKDYFEYCATKDEVLKNVEFTFVEQQKPLGSGNALLYAEKFCKKERFLLANCDEVFSANACRQLLATGGLAVGVKKISHKDANKYGMVVTEETLVKRVEEKPKEFLDLPLALVGRYLLDGRIFDCLRQVPFVGGELRLTDALNVLCSKTAVKVSDLLGKRFDVGSPEGYKKAFNYFTLHKKLTFV